MFVRGYYYFKPKAGINYFKRAEFWDLFVLYSIYRITVKILLTDIVKPSEGEINVWTVCTVLLHLNLSP